MVSRTGAGALPSWELERATSARVARLATVRADGRPHVVPVTFALTPSSLVTTVDSKPKRTTDLQRLRNVATHPAVSVLIDSYHEDWSRLWWVRLDGHARTVQDPGLREECLAALLAKYEQYREWPPAGPVMVVDLISWASWSAEG